MKETVTPSIVVSIINEGEPAYTRAFGFRNTAAGLPATERTLYGVGSVTKSFTCLALSQLQEEGKIDLNDPISKYLPSDFDAFQEGVKIHHLMSHSSGMPGLGYAEAFLGGILGYEGDWLPVSKPQDIITFMQDARDWNDAKPGERFYYLNEGYALLGEVISKASRMPYDEYIKAKILEPLEMKRSFFQKRDVESQSDRAVPYITTKEKKLVESVIPYGIYADGGLISNVLDLSNYLKMYLGRGTFNGKAIASKKSIEEMEAPRVKYPYSLFENSSYGYGLFNVPNFFGKKLIQHSGSVGVYSAFIGYLPEAKIGISLLSNSSGYSPGDLAMYALASFIGEDPRRLAFVEHENYLKKLEGRYDAYKGTYRADIKLNGDFLTFRILNKIEESETVFVPDQLGDKVAIFHTSIRKRKYILEFRFKPEGIEMIFERYKFRKVAP
jgi:CubicO group peptidase (beta-lactamase class C family)